ncbi:hypothetical protein [Kribbella sp. NPDC048928]|uniref:hypothetical protein n=1 Tax=Kribbella sp. NPDC048928 TaxID=3364111 RepID=UPI0037156156
MAAEYLRRTAVWADALAVRGKWPMFDLAVMLDPAVVSDAVWQQRLYRELEFYGGSVPFRSIAERLTQAPFPIDTATLEEVDEKEQIRTEEAMARRSEQASAEMQPPAQQA